MAVTGREHIRFCSGCLASYRTRPHHRRHDGCDWHSVPRDRGPHPDRRV